MESTGLEVRVLGPFQVTRDGRPLALTSSRLRALLATLAVSAGSFVSVEALGTAVWGRAQPANLRSSLQTYVARLRRAIGDDVIATSPGGYRLRLAADRVDARLFLRLASVPKGQPGERADLAAALRLWQGTPFQGVDSEWLVQSEAVRLTEAYLDVLERLADLDLAAGRAGELLTELRAACERHPLREPLWARLVLALDAVGQRAAALAAYERFRDRLADELGSDPGPGLRQIHAGLLAPAAPGTQVPRQLPSDITGFTGRADVLAALDRVPEGVVVLHGTGGSGKTATAVHWAHGRPFPDGTLFVNLRGYGPATPVRPAVALDGLLRALGVEGRQIPADAEGRAALLRERLAGRRALLVLDNARDAEQVLPLLPGGQNLVVVTSRSTLRELSGVRRVAVDVLTAPEAAELLAGSLEPGYGDAELVELAELCGRLPLALAVAAEHAGRHPGSELGGLVAELRDRRDRLDALEVAGDPASSVRTVFSWSIETLDPDCVRAFQLLGLHPGPDIGAPAAAALLAASIVRTGELLNQLVDAHLVEQRRPGRYQLHDLLQVYAAELATALPAAERADALARVLAWYAHTAANGRQAIGRGESLGETGELPAGLVPLAFADESWASAWYDIERPVLLAAVELAADVGLDRAAYRLAWQLSGFQILRYALDDLMRVQRIALVAARRTGDVVAEAVTTGKLGAGHLMRSDYEPARALLERAVALFVSAGHVAGEASVRANLGIVLQALRQFDAAIECHERGLAIARRSGRPHDVVILLNNLAMSYIQVERFDDAVDACREALKLPTDKPFVRADLWDTLGQALDGSDRHAEAIDAYEQALERVRELRDRWAEATVLSNLGRTQYAAGRPDQARLSWQQALAVMEEDGIADGHELSRADLLDKLALVHKD